MTYWILIRTQNLVSIRILASLKVTGDSLLIHEFAYSHYSSVSVRVTSNMTSCSHSYHSIKLIHCGAPQRDALSDQVQVQVQVQFYFINNNGHTTLHK